MDLLWIEEEQAFAIVYSWVPKQEADLFIEQAKQFKDYKYMQLSEKQLICAHDLEREMSKKGCWAIVAHYNSVSEPKIIECVYGTRDEADKNRQEHEKTLSEFLKDGTCPTFSPVGYALIALPFILPPGKKEDKDMVKPTPPTKAAEMRAKALDKTLRMLDSSISRLTEQGATSCDWTLNEPAFAGAVNQYLEKGGFWFKETHCQSSKAVYYKISWSHPYASTSRTAT